MDGTCKGKRKQTEENKLTKYTVNRMKLGILITVTKIADV